MPLVAPTIYRRLRFRSRRLLFLRPRKFQTGRNTRRIESPEVVPTIVFESADYVVISKPAGLDSQDSRADRPSVVQWLTEHFGFPGLVHRLDFGTSGLMVCAKSPKSAADLNSMMLAGEINRIYLALAMGTGLAREGQFKTPVEDKEALTSYRVRDQFANAMLIELKLDTGRKHQIRRHLFEAGHPLIGDHLYKKKGSDRLFKRPALHAYRLILGDKAFETPMPEDMAELLERLRKSRVL